MPEPELSQKYTQNIHQQKTNNLHKFEHQFKFNFEIMLRPKFPQPILIRITDPIENIVLLNIFSLCQRSTLFFHLEH